MDAGFLKAEVGQGRCQGKQQNVAKDEETAEKNQHIRDFWAAVRTMAWASS
ncbi:MAG: hypothetical protein ACLTG0_08085 [Oscillibacter sp.]